MIKNSTIQKYLNEIAEKYVVDGYRVDMRNIEKIIFPLFFEWDGCILLKQENGNLPPSFSRNKFIPDRTAFEAEYNHIHVNDLFDETTVQPIEIFRVATMIMDVWAAVLNKKFNGRYNFMLILSFDGEEVVLRFYTKREDETPWIDVTAVEACLDGVMVLEI